MDNPKISVIVPVYKAEHYLARCVDTLLAQTFDDFEAILVDDGSPDNSGAICDEYALKDKRVRVIHQPNAGVSMARQKGLDNARGEYVIHADPDDWVEPDMLKELYAKVKEEDADMVICDFYAHYGEKVVYERQQPSSLDPNTVLCDLFKHLHGSCWNKLVRRVCFLKFDIQFSEGVSFCEDLLINSTLLQHNIKVAYLSNAFYHYDCCINSNSLVRKKTSATFEKDKRLILLFEKALSGSVVVEKAKSHMSYLLLLRAFEGHFFSSREYRRRCRSYILYSFDTHDFLMGSLLFFSCLGFYHLMFLLWNLLRKIKLLVKIIFKLVRK